MATKSPQKMNSVQCAKFRKNPLKNPLSGRPIKKGGETYEKLRLQCDEMATKTTKAKKPKPTALQIINESPRVTKEEKQQCVEFLEQTFKDKFNINEHDNTCKTTFGTNYKAVDVINDKICCRAIKKETKKEFTQRSLRVSLKIIEKITTQEQRNHVKGIAEQIVAKKGRKGALKELYEKMFSYVSNLFKAGSALTIKHPMTMIIITSIIIIASMGYTNNIVANLTNQVKFYSPNGGIEGASGETAIHLAKASESIAKAKMLNVAMEAYGQLMTTASKVWRATSASAVMGSITGVFSPSTGMIIGAAALATETNQSAVEVGSKLANTTANIFSNSANIFSKLINLFRDGNQAHSNSQKVIPDLLL